jgi:xylan 1,4-beta-xylosidase
MTVARSRTLEGPYEIDPLGHLLTAKDHRDLPLQRCGHGDLFDTPGGDSYLVHLCSRPLPGLQRSPLGRETGLQKFEWSEDGWPRLEGATGDGLPALELGSPGLPEQAWPAAPARHDFDEPDLPIDFQWLRSPEPQRFMSLSERPGFLRLKGRESLGSWFEQALVARRQKAFRFTAETRLEFEPTNFQQAAGLVSYYNTHKYHYCYVSVDENGQRFVDIMSCEAREDWISTFPLSEGHAGARFIDPRCRLPSDGPVWLRAEVDDAVLRFSFSTDGERWNRLAAVLNQSLVSDEAGKGEGASFTGAFIGMACQDISGQGCVADFDYFEYVERD